MKPTDPARPDIFLTPPLLGRTRLIDGDVVDVTYIEEEGRTSALSAKVLARSRTRLFGIIRNGEFFADPFLAKGSFPVLRPFPTRTCAALVEITPQNNVKVLETWDDPIGAPALYARALERARVAERDTVAALPQRTSQRERRRDLTKLTTITIDGPESRDLDDALSIEALGNGRTRLYVHIADVANAVPLHSPADKRARALATSTYLPGHSVPMMPEELSYDECSLLPNKTRNTLTVAMDVTAEGDIRSVDVFESLIRSDARLSYEEVAGFLKKSSATTLAPAVQATLNLLNVATTRLALKRQARGGLRVNEGDSSSDLVVRDGVVALAKSDDAAIAHDLIEEAMVATNEVIAQWLSDRGLPGIFRTHAAPGAAAVSALTTFAKQFGIDACLPEVLTPTSLAALERQVHEREPQANVFNVLADYLPRALYQATPGLHFGLASESYVHFTSPIRRYADLTVHRIIKAHLQGKPQPHHDFETLCNEINEGTSRAARAESISRSLLYAVLLQSHKSDTTYRAYVSRVSTRGVFIRLVDYGVSGWILARDLSSKEPILDENALTCTIGNDTYTLGQVLTVRVHRTDTEAGSVEFLPIHARATPPSTRAPRTQHGAKKSTSASKKHQGSTPASRNPAGH